MKKIFALMSIMLCTGMLCFTSCDDDEMDESIPVNPVVTPIKSLTAQDGSEIATAEINDKERTIHLSLKNLRSLESVDVKMSVSKRAKLISPTDTILTLDLRQPYEIVINNLFKDLTYTLTAEIPEFIEIKKNAFQEFRMNNDSPKQEGDILNLWDGEIMAKPEDYGSIGYRNYLTGECFTVDLGDHYNLYRFRASLYWAYTNVCPKKYELYGYTKDGEPAKDGNWADWTKLGSLDNSDSLLSDFGEGDNLYFTKETTPKVRYIRVRCLENYRGTTAISLCEITFWAYNM